MFINKWLLTDSFNKDAHENVIAGFCLYLSGEPENIGDLYNFLQQQPVEKSFAVLLAGNDFEKEKVNDSYVEKMLGLFFQPNYYLYNYQPLIFLSNRTPACTEFLNRLTEKCKGQGLSEILVLETSAPDYTNTSLTQFAFRIANDEINYSLIIKDWLDKYLADKSPSEIYLLVSAKKEDATEIFSKLTERENALKETEEYKLAIAFYQKQKLIDDYKHQLSLKMISEKDMQGYLNIQKEERANGLKWYYHEYEILPTWYKRFGHVIKVITGKRSFKSLFNDNVKKYKD